MGNIKDKPRYFFHYGRGSWLEIVPHPTGKDCLHGGDIARGNICTLFGATGCSRYCISRKATFKEIPIVQH